MVLASMFYAGSAVYVRRTTVNTPASLRSAGPLLSATAIMWLAAFLIERPIKIPQLEITWVALLYLGILGSGFAFFLGYYLIHEIGPTRPTMVTYFFPLGGIILGVVFLNEKLSWQLLAGTILIIASLMIVNWQPLPAEAAVLGGEDAAKSINL